MTNILSGVALTVLLGWVLVSLRFLGEDDNDVY